MYLTKLPFNLVVVVFLPSSMYSPSRSLPRHLYHFPTTIVVASDLSDTNEVGPISFKIRWRLSHHHQDLSLPPHNYFQKEHHSKPWWLMVTSMMGGLRSECFNSFLDDPFSLNLIIVVFFFFFNFSSLAFSCSSLFLHLSFIFEIRISQIWFKAW